MESGTLTIIVFLGGQLLLNIGVMSHFNGRLARVETHLIHIMKKNGMNVRDNELTGE